MNKFLKFWLPVLVWAGIIFWLSSIPDLESGLEQDFILRKIAHILEYAILTFLLLRAFTKKRLSIKKIAIYSIIFCIFYSLTDEYHQTFVFGRQGTLKDVGIDSIGILIMSLMWYIKNKGRNLS
jgi:VanZ family protein